MNRLFKGLLIGVLVAITGPFGLIAVLIYAVRKHQIEQQKQTQLLTQAITAKEGVAQ
jgi:hypothetical protein